MSNKFSETVKIPEKKMVSIKNSHSSKNFLHKEPTNILKSYSPVSLNKNRKKSINSLSQRTLYSSKSEA